MYTTFPWYIFGFFTPHVTLGVSNMLETAFCQALGPEKVWQRDGRGWTWQLSELEKDLAVFFLLVSREISAMGNPTNYRNKWTYMGPDL